MLTIIIPSYIVPYNRPFAWAYSHWMKSKNPFLFFLLHSEWDEFSRNVTQIDTTQYLAYGV